MLLLRNSLLNREPARKHVFLERLVFYFKILCVFFFLPVIWHKKHKNRYIIISEGWIGFIMICASMIFATSGTVDTLTQHVNFWQWISFTILSNRHFFKLDSHAWMGFQSWRILFFIYTTILPSQYLKGLCQGDTRKWLLKTGDSFICTDFSLRDPRKMIANDWALFWTMFHYNGSVYYNVNSCKKRTEHAFWQTIILLS